MLCCTSVMRELHLYLFNDLLFGFVSDKKSTVAREHILLLMKFDLIVLIELLLS